MVSMFKFTTSIPLGWVIVFALSFFGPTGKLFIPVESLASFRLFYIFSFLFVMYYVFCFKKDNLSIFVIISSITMVMVLFLSVILNFNKYGDVSDINLNPVVRLLIHSVIVLSFFFVSDYINKNHSFSRFEYLNCAIWGYLTCLFLGFLIYVLFIYGIISYDFYNSFNIISQDAYGFTRFTPGTYPNEFGTIASFFTSSLILILFNKSKLDKIFAVNRLLLMFFIVISLLGLILSTTRSAYLTFILSLVYVLFKQSIKTVLVFFTFILLSFALIIAIADESFVRLIVDVFNNGYTSAVDGTGSINERYIAWKVALDFFMETPYLGVGFENDVVSMMHNVYLQFLFGLGIILFPIFIICLCVCMVVIRSRCGIKINIHEKKAQTNFDDVVYHRLFVISIIHVLFFATNNHNQNHFLTWFAVSLFLTSRYFFIDRRNGGK